MHHWVSFYDFQNVGFFSSHPHPIALCLVGLGMVSSFLYADDAVAIAAM